MPRLRIPCLAAAAALLALPALGEDQIISRVGFWKAKPGMEAKLEEGIKRHNEFHRKLNDPMGFDTFVVTSGPNAGSYLRIASGRRWQDFDAEAAGAKADQADSALNTDPYLESTTTSYYRLRPEMSRSRPGDTPAPMYSVLIYKVKFGKADEFVLAAKKFKEAADKAQWPRHWAFFSLANGGDHPQFVLSQPRDKFADFNPPEKPFDKMLEEILGRDEADARNDMLERSVESFRSEIITYRADLSYVPAKK